MSGTLMQKPRQPEEKPASPVPVNAFSARTQERKTESVQTSEHPSAPSPAAAGFGTLAQNTDATGRAVREEKADAKTTQETKPYTPPIPQRKPEIDAARQSDPEKNSILSDININAIRNEVAGHEGRTEHLYKDSGRDGGFVTVGYGHKIDDVEKAKKIAFMVKAPISVMGESGPMSVMGLRRATDQEIERAFQKIHAIRNKNYAAKAFKPGEGAIARKYGLDDLILPEQEAEKLLIEDIAEHETYVKNQLKNRDMIIEKIPPSIRELLVDIHFNTGNVADGLYSAIKKKDWPQAKAIVRQYKTGQERVSRRLQKIDQANELHGDNNK